MKQLNEETYLGKHTLGLPDIISPSVVSAIQWSLHIYITLGENSNMVISVLLQANVFVFVVEIYQKGVTKCCSKLLKTLVDPCTAHKHCQLEWYPEQRRRKLTNKNKAFLLWSYLLSSKHSLKHLPISLFVIPTTNKQANLWGDCKTLTPLLRRNNNSTKRTKESD